MRTLISMIVWRAGKSTLLRQVCLAALMAQVGAWVPAESLELTPVDAIFVRMGARDAIMTGQVHLCSFVAEVTARKIKQCERRVSEKGCLAI